MFTSNTFRLRVAAAALCAAAAVATGWAAWIPLAQRIPNSAPTATAMAPTADNAEPRQPANSATVVPPVVIEATVTNTEKPHVSPPAVVDLTMPVDLPELLSAGRTPAIDAVARGLVWTVSRVERLDRTDGLPPAGAQSSDPTGDEPVAPNQDEIVLYNPTTSGGPVHFLAAGAPHTLQPGQQRTWRREELGVLRFHRGGDFGNARIELSPGAYEFQVGAAGWDVVALDPGSASASQ